MSNESFSNRWGIILASLGMAIGAGNLWRFPRLAGQYGGTFIILLVFFLVLWSIPILMAEFSIGKRFKKGVIGSFSSIGGKKTTWMGVFMLLCCMGITFYYSVVTAWGMRYLVLASEQVWLSWTGGFSLADALKTDPQYLDNQWNALSNGSYTTIAFHIGSVVLSALALYRGVQQGLELINKILIPALFVLLLFIVGISVTMDGGTKGLEYMFAIRWELFGDSRVWIEALSQSAWSTGAGWGLVMTIAAYSREKEDVTLNTFIGGFGNYTACLMAAMGILPAVFALAPSEAAAVEYLQKGNQALTFLIIPKLFAQFQTGVYLSFLFFLSFCFAAFTSLLSMIELVIKALTDFKMNRRTASILTVVICSVCGLPSAYSLDIFNNQDWVWGLGLIISGLFVIFVVLKYGLTKFKTELIDADSDFKFPNTLFRIFLYINLLLGVFLLYWWMSQGYSKYPWFDAAGNWNFFDVYSNATIVSQWAVILVIGLVLNNWIFKKINS